MGGLDRWGGVNVVEEVSVREWVGGLDRWVGVGGGWGVSERMGLGEWAGN